MSVAISIRLPDELAEHLKGIAKRRTALQVALDRLRDKTDAVVTSKELRKSLGL